MTLIRSVIEAQGIYANHRVRCLENFRSTCGGLVDITPFEAVFDAWDRWEEGAPSIEEMAAWYGQIAEEAEKLCSEYGAGFDESFSNWPPPAI